MRALRALEKPPEVQREDDPFTLNATLITTFIMVSSIEEYHSGAGIKFQPDYLHQVFRETNEIYGYKNLKITIYVTALNLVPYIIVIIPSLKPRPLTTK